MKNKSNLSQNITKLESSLMSTWISYSKQLLSIQKELSIRDWVQDELGLKVGFGLWNKWSLDVRSSGKCLFLVGNGASASMASHFAIDMMKNIGICTETFNEPSLLTALSNDYCYEDVFAKPLGWKMKKGDMLVAISSSGNSPNIVRAVETAKRCCCRVVTLSAMGTDNAIRKLGDLNLYVPAPTYGLAESAHAVILHYWVDSLMTEVEN